jgi:hypothetical protein
MNDYQSTPPSLPLCPLTHAPPSLLSGQLAHHSKWRSCEHASPPLSLPLTRSRLLCCVPSCRVQGISYVWKEYWTPAYTAPAQPLLTSATESVEEGKVEVAITPGGLFSSTKSLLDDYYRPHNANLKALLEKHGALSREFPFPSTWPVEVAVEEEKEGS